MAFTDLTSFRSEVADFLHRGDVTANANVIGSWIELAEAELNSQLRVRQMEDVTSTSATGGYLVHPSDWLAHKSIARVSGGKNYILQPFSEESAEQQLGLSGSTTPEGYSVLGDKTYLKPTGTGTYRMTYYKKIPALTTSATTNWVLTNFPTLYLGLVLKYAALWGINDDRIGLMAAGAQDVIVKLNNAAKQASYGQVPQQRVDRYY